MPLRPADLSLLTSHRTYRTLRPNVTTRTQLTGSMQQAPFTPPDRASRDKVQRIETVQTEVAIVGKVAAPLGSRVTATSPPTSLALPARAPILPS